MHEDVLLSRQLERMSRWKDPVVDAVTATILWRKRRIARTDSEWESYWKHYESENRWRYEFFVTERMRGAAKGHHQAHHGGFIKPTDKSVRHAAAREVTEETGYLVNPDKFHFVAKFGPELYRSTARLVGDKALKLTITDTQAEPGIPFALDLFVAEVSRRTRRTPTDKEVKEVGWFTLEEMTDRYGDSMTFNYWSFLFQACKFLEDQHSDAPGDYDHFPDSSPGVYTMW